VPGCEIVFSLPPSSFRQVVDEVPPLHQQSPVHPGMFSRPSSQALTRSLRQHPRSFSPPHWVTEMQVSSEFTLSVAVAPPH
jgi:hypothetical protein